MRGFSPCMEYAGTGENKHLEESGVFFALYRLDKLLIQMETSSFNPKVSQRLVWVKWGMDILCPPSETSIIC
jgi:hypothetical protein